MGQERIRRSAYPIIKTKDDMEINHKKEDTAKIAAYLRTRSNEDVPVDGIMLNSGAKRPCVYPILFEWNRTASSK